MSYSDPTILGPRPARSRFQFRYMAWGCIFLAVGSACGSDGDESTSSRGGAGGAGGLLEGGSGGVPAGGSAGAGASGAAGGAGGAGARGGVGGGPNGGGSASGGAAAICTECDGACETAVALDTAAHMEGDIDYVEDPPAGGPHNGCWVDWGIYTEPVRPENWVHNLEHGGVVFLYNCPDGCADDVTALEELVDGRVQAILSPQPDMSPRFAVVSWGHRLSASCLDIVAFEAFYEAHVDNAPESVTGGAPAGCP